jgi:hypothetical protein
VRVVRLVGTIFELNVYSALNYMKKDKFRSGVLIEFGPPLDLVADDQDIDASVPPEKRDCTPITR